MKNINYPHQAFCYKNTNHKKCIKRELCLLLIFNLTSLWALTSTNLLDKLHSISTKCDSFEFNELITTSFILSFSFALFAYHRWREELKILSNMYVLAIKDQLTGAYNRRYIIDFLTAEIDRSKRTSSTFSVIIIDVDDFKNINDQYGHNTGDIALSQLAELLNKSIRSTDILARWGGEEFLIACPETDIKGTLNLAEKIQFSVTNHNFPDIKKVTISMGISSYQKQDCIKSLISRADKLLYKAKKLGKNRFLPNNLSN